MLILIKNNSFHRNLWLIPTSVIFVYPPKNICFTHSADYLCGFAIQTNIIFRKFRCFSHFEYRMEMGENLSTFRDLLDVCEIRPRSWEPYVLFIEECDEDIEDIHRIIIALDARGIFRHVVALVVGRMKDRHYTQNLQRLLFGKPAGKQADELVVKNVFEYLISDVITDRIKELDPLYILKINNFGHFGNQMNTKNMFIPIGARTRIYPDGKIEFIGPFVE